MSKTIDIRLIGNDTNIEVGEASPTSNTITVDFDTLPRTVSWDSIVGKPNGRVFGGIITPETIVPMTPDSDVFFTAFTAGTYNFGFTLSDGYMAYVWWNGSVWSNSIQEIGSSLTFDDTPTEGSDNPVTSDGIYNALQGKVNVIHVDGIGNLTEQQVLSLMPGDVVVDNLHRNSPSYVVSTQRQGSVTLVRVDGCSIITCIYNHGVYVDTVVETLAQKASEYTEGNIISFDENGNLTDSGYFPSDLPKKLIVDSILQLTSSQLDSLKAGDIVIVRNQPSDEDDSPYFVTAKTLIEDYKLLELTDLEENLVRKVTYQGEEEWDTTPRTDNYYLDIPVTGRSIVDSSVSVLREYACNLGTVSSDFSITLSSYATPVLSGKLYWWRIIFKIGNTVPNITWPSEITIWDGGAEPTLKANTNYDITVYNNGWATCMSDDIPTYSSKIVVENIEDIPSQQVESLDNGDIVIMDSGSDRFTYIVIISEDGGRKELVCNFGEFVVEVWYVLNNDTWEYFETKEFGFTEKADKVSNAVNGHLAALDIRGNLKDSGIAPSSLATQSDISGFITNTVNNLTNYYLKSETYTQAEINALIGAIQQFHYEIYATLPQTGQSNVLYLIGPTGSGSDKYEEYVYSNSVFTKIGDTSIDLSGYVTTSALNTALADYTTTANLTTLLSDKADKCIPSTTGNIAKLTAQGNLADGGVLAADVATVMQLEYKADRVNNATNGNLAGLDSNGNLTDSGSKASDFATATQGALADTAYQKPSTGIPASDLASGVIPAVPVQDVTVGGTSVLSNGVAVVPAIPTVPTISTNIASDATSDTKTTSPKAVKTFVEGKGYGTYSKPQGGIPESDLSSDVQQALQKHFKGWYASSSALPANPIVGDYAYVKGAASTAPAAIYECTTAGSWSDSGRIADTSNVQTFATGEEVNEVHIVNDLTTGGAADVLSAEQGKVLGDKFRKSDFSVGLFEDGYYNTKSTTLPSTRNNLSGCKSAKLSVQNGQLYKIYGFASTSDYYRIYALYDSNGDRIERYDTSATYRTSPLVVTIPTNAVTMVVNLVSYDSSTDKLLCQGDYYDLNNIQSEITTIQDDIVTTHSATFAGNNTNIITLNNPIVLSQEGDVLEICVSVAPGYDSNDNAYPLSSSGNSSSNYISVGISQNWIALRAKDGTWIYNDVVSNLTTILLKIVYTDTSIKVYRNGTLLTTYSGTKEIRIVSFGNGCNGSYGYWKGTINYLKVNGLYYDLSQQTYGDVVIGNVYNYISENALRNGILEYSASKKAFTFYSRVSGDKYVSFIVKLLEDNDDMVYLKSWGWYGGDIYTHFGDAFIKGSEVMYNGENEMTMKLNNAIDFTGGIHGDERIDVSPDSFVKFFADGKLINSEDLANNFTIPCSSFSYMQMSTLHATSTTEGEYVPDHPIIATHLKVNTFINGSSSLENVIEFTSTQNVVIAHAGIACIGKGAATYAIVPASVVTPKLTGTDNAYCATTPLPAKARFWNPDNGASATVEGHFLWGFDDVTDIPITNSSTTTGFHIWDRTTDSKYYRRSRTSKIFESGEKFITAQEVKFYV